MIKKIILLCLIFFIALILQTKAAKTLGTKNKSAWVWLFNGTSTDAWESISSDNFPEEGWKVIDNQLVVLPKTESFAGGHDIITKKLYSNFELELEFKLTEGANSGIKYFVVNNFPGKEGQYLGLEYQLIDNERHPDAKLGVDGNRKMSSLYDLIAPNADCPKVIPGKWNNVRIVVNGNHVEHWLNGKKILEFERTSESFRELVQNSKYKNLSGFGEAEKGHILLQGHGDEVAFRSIKIRTW